ncbi:MAG: hypothetical protein CVU88_03135 [Firmicutes bacterium HGW-Firmicutes-13]|nr:MAG: hypothetical protein CVU88_03135 [Firmicutes bacterium HGW-Firmicutes-13]
MFNHDFNEIFTELEEIETNLSAAKNEEEIELLTNKLVNLRQQMDQFINFWLRFEEKVNILEQKYNLNLPDDLFENLPDSLLENLDSADENLLNNKNKRMDLDLVSNQLSENISEKLFYTIEDPECICSFRRGLGYFDLAMLEEAIVEFRKVIEKEPNFLIGHFYLGMVYSEMEKYDKALKEFRLVMALSKNSRLNAIIHNCTGNIYAEQEKYEKALESFEEALKEDENFVDVYFNQGATYYNMGKYQESIIYFKKALNYFKNDWEIFYYLGKAYGNLGRLEEAIYYIEKSARLNSNFAAIHLELGILYELTGEKNKAESHYHKIKD